jgi:hypothetical protein
MRKINGSEWSYSLKCWHFPYSDTSIDEIRKLKQLPDIDILHLDKLLEERKYKYFDRIFGRETEHMIESFQQWMVSQRYSPRTIATYVHDPRSGYIKVRDPERNIRKQA